MKINPVYFISNKINNSANNQTFGQGPVTNPLESQNVPNVMVDYSVKVPMSYKFIEEISLPNNLKAYSYKLANGQKIVIVPKEGATVVKSYVNTGSLNEPDNLRGISHYIEHNLFNGSEDLGDKDFFEEVNKMGANTNASTSFSVTDYYVESQLLEDGDLEKKIMLHAGMLQSPKFLEDKLAKEKNIVDSEINRCLSDDSSRAESITIKNLFNIKSSAPDLVAGSTNNIDALTRDDVVNYFNNNYYPANMVTVITGEVDPEKTMPIVAKYFNSSKVPDGQRHYEVMQPIEKSVRQDVLSQKKQGAAEIFLGFTGPENANSQDKVYLRAVMHLFMDLANSRVKETELKYSSPVSCNCVRLGTRPDDKTAQIINLSVPRNMVEPALKDLYSAIDSLSKYPPTEDEFNAVKNQIKKINSKYIQSSEVLNYHLGMAFLNQTPYAMKDYNSILDNMSYNDFIETAKKYFDLNKAALTVVHPVGVSEEDVKNNYSKVYSNIPSFTGNNKKLPLNVDRIKEYDLPNNFRVILQDADTDVVNYMMWLDTHDWTPHKAAVSDVLNEMMNFGTIYRNKYELDKLFDKNGISKISTFADDKVIIAGDFPLENTDKALELYREGFMAPNLTEKTFNESVKRCLLKYSTSEPRAEDNFDKYLFENTYFSTTNQDKLKSLSEVTFEDVKQLYNEVLSKSQGTVVVTGPFDKNPELKQTIFNNISKYNTVKPKNMSLYDSFKPVEKTKVYTTETKRNQAKIMMGFRFKQNENIKDELCFSLLNSILGDGSSSRLFSDLREKRHLCYTVSSNYMKANNLGVFGLQIETTTNNIETGDNSFDNIQKSIEGFKDNIQRITSEPVSSDELERAKKTLKTQILSCMEMNEDKNAVLMKCSQTPYGINHINQQLELIDSITPEDILSTAKYIFSSKPIYSIAGTKEALDANADYLNKLEN